MTEQGSDDRGDPRDWRQGPWETYEEFVHENGPWPPPSTAKEGQ